MQLKQPVTNHAAKTFAKHCIKDNILEAPYRNYGYTPQILRDRIILITGASDGIGRALARHTAELGARVVLHGRNVAKLEAVYDGIVAAGGPQPAIYPMDLEGATPDDYRDLAENVESQLGRLDGLLHNAGLLGSLTPIEHYDPVEWLRVIQKPWWRRRCRRRHKVGAGAAGGCWDEGFIPREVRGAIIGRECR